MSWSPLWGICDDFNSPKAKSISYIKNTKAFHVDICPISRETLLFYIYRYNINNQFPEIHGNFMVYDYRDASLQVISGIQGIRKMGKSSKFSQFHHVLSFAFINGSINLPQHLTIPLPWVGPTETVWASV